MSPDETHATANGSSAQSRRNDRACRETIWNSSAVASRVTCCISVASSRRARSIRSWRTMVLPKSTSARVMEPSMPEVATSLSSRIFGRLRRQAGAAGCRSRRARGRDHGVIGRNGRRQSTLMKSSSASCRRATLDLVSRPRHRALTARRARLGWLCAAGRDVFRA